MRNIARSILKQYGIKVPTDSKTMVTHQAIKTLINVLQTENKKNNTKFKKLKKPINKIYGAVQ